ncbi:MAG: triose-phosphate isomerase [Bacteroidetes bacterium]|nr:triose-phosphate isomerase [Bacteroidota bacterium]
MRKHIVAGNWKMNLLAQEAETLSNAIVAYIKQNQIEENTEVILAPPAIYLKELAEATEPFAKLNIAAQNCHQAASGAFTGELSAPMLSNIGVDYVIIGHSERRLYFQESNEVLRQKILSALSNDLQPIFCCGEDEAIRDQDQHEDFIAQQLKESLFDLEASEIAQCVIAYEPIWAIGTGKTASSEQAQKMHHFIRSLIAKQYGNDLANSMTILYGGSCKPSNAKELFSQPDVDGGLIGGASLSADQFIPIIESF